MESLETARGEKEVLERAQTGHKRRCRMRHLEADQQFGGDGSQVGVAHLACKISKRKFFDVQLGAMVASLLGVENV